VGLIADLGPGPVDTAVFIYLIEEHPRYLPLILPLFEEADQGRRTVITSALTLLEVLVVPYRTLDARLAQRYEMLLARSRGVRLVEVTREHLRVPGQFRALGSVRTPDALQLACAMTNGCRTFLTNDRGLPRVTNLRVIELKSYARADSD
jgi:predicted nucleic acid-binding protein